jgi:hypothetical protein
LRINSSTIVLKAQIVRREGVNYQQAKSTLKQVISINLIIEGEQNEETEPSADCSEGRY